MPKQTFDQQFILKLNAHSCKHLNLKGVLSSVEQTKKEQLHTSITTKFKAPINDVIQNTNFKK